MEPLFLDSPMHEKIWGGNRLKTEFGYDIPSEHTGESVSYTHLTLPTIA